MPARLYRKLRHGAARRPGRSGRPDRGANVYKLVPAGIVLEASAPVETGQSCASWGRPDAGRPRAADDRRVGKSITGRSASGGAPVTGPEPGAVCPRTSACSVGNRADANAGAPAAPGQDAAGRAESEVSDAIRTVGLNRHERKYQAQLSGGMKSGGGPGPGHRAGRGAHGRAFAAVGRTGRGGDAGGTAGAPRTGSADHRLHHAQHRRGPHWATGFNREGTRPGRISPTRARAHRAAPHHRLRSGRHPAYRIARGDLGSSCGSAAETGRRASGTGRCA